MFSGILSFVRFLGGMSAKDFQIWLKFNFIALWSVLLLLLNIYCIWANGLSFLSRMALYMQYGYLPHVELGLNIAEFTMLLLLSVGYLILFRRSLLNPHRVRQHLYRATSLHGMERMRYYQTLGAKTGVRVSHSPVYREVLSDTLFYVEWLADYDKKLNEGKLDPRVVTVLKSLRREYNEPILGSLNNRS